MLAYVLPILCGRGSSRLRCPRKSFPKGETGGGRRKKENIFGVPLDSGNAVQHALRKTTAFLVTKQEFAVGDGDLECQMCACVVWGFCAGVRGRGAGPDLITI
jgi:hypothetical protein